MQTDDLTDDQRIEILNRKMRAEDALEIHRFSSEEENEPFPNNDLRMEYYDLYWAKLSEWTIAEAILLILPNHTQFALAMLKIFPKKYTEKTTRELITEFMLNCNPAPLLMKDIEAGVKIKESLIDPKYKVVDRIEFLRWACKHKGCYVPKELRESILTEVPHEKNTETVLTERENKILEVLLKEGATNQARRMITDDIATKADGVNANGENFKKTITGLKKKDLVQTAQIKGGGVWLTPRGQEIAKG